jgi:hypothetical protein
MSTGRQLLEELRKDEELRRALAEELLPEALRHRELRKAMLIAISREMATKDDVEGLEEDVEALRKEIEGLRMAMKEDVEGLRKVMATKEDMEKLRAYVDARMDSLNERISDLYGIVKTSPLAIVVTLASTILTPLILKLLLRL